MRAKGVVAAGDLQTAQAAAEVLKYGGNAFDAVLAALFASTVAEPVLSSLGGGGFLMAKPANGSAVLFDFFSQTPKVKKTDVDFKPILADFGTVSQEFHIGLGSMATPGVVKGAFDIHRAFGTMPMRDIVAPACTLAKGGFALSPLQAYIFEIVELIYTSNPICQAQFQSPLQADALIRAGETLRIPQAADFMDALAREGDDLFYYGEVAEQVAKDCEDGGGHLHRSDFEAYRVLKRDPLEVTYKGARMLTNPPPSVGGILIGFALQVLENSGLGKQEFGSFEHLDTLAKVMDLTNQARVESGLNLHPESGAESLLDPAFLTRYANDVLGSPASHRGTTQISVVDAKGNAASMTVSNGEGSSYIVPQTGMVMNNMLGEEDINPQGLQNWGEDARMSSMMAPSLIEHGDGQLLVLGSGGSNRIRTAILQVVHNVLEFSMPFEVAVEQSRIHFENGVLNVEPGFGDGSDERLRAAFENVELWDQKNLFFGGVHSVEFNPQTKSLSGQGDLRRGGVSLVV